METRKDTRFEVRYESPVLEYLDCCSEGVLCQSSPAQGESWNDGGII